MATQLLTPAVILLARTAAGCTDRRWNHNRSCQERAPETPRTWCLTCLGRAAAQAATVAPSPSSVVGVAGFERVVLVAAAATWAITIVYLAAVAAGLTEGCIADLIRAIGGGR